MLEGQTSRQWCRTVGSSSNKFFEAVVGEHSSRLTVSVTFLLGC